MNTLLKYRKYFWIFILVGFVIYFPIIFNEFVWDDFPYIINNPEMHQFNLPLLLGKNLFNSGPFYRPIPAIYFAFMYSLFSNQAFFYHTLQLTLHIIDTFFLLTFFCLFFSEGISYFLALLFLVHPINVESVAFIGSTGSELYFFFGIVALLLSTKQSLTVKKFILISILLLLAILTKETGFLFLPLIFLYRYLFRQNKLKEVTIAGACIATVYLLLRTAVGGVTTAKLSFVQIASLSFSQRLLNIPAIIMYYVKIFIFPLHLAIWQVWVVKGVTWQGFFFPLLLCSVLLGFLLTVIFLLYKNDKKHARPVTDEKQKKNNRKFVAVEQKRFQLFFFFLFWFIFGIGLILQLVPLDMTVADRWFYFPMVGVLGMIGVGLQTIFPFWSQQRKLLSIGAIILLCLLSLRTFTRTFNWKDNLTLYTHDLKEENENYLLLGEYATELYQAGKMDEAYIYATKSVALHQTVKNLNELGRVYQHKRQYTKALINYTRAIQLAKIHTEEEQNELYAYTNKAAVLLFAGHPADAIQFINEYALKRFPQNEKLYFLLAIAEYNLHDQQKALEAATKAIDLSPSDLNNTLYNKIRNKESLNFRDTT